MSIYKEENSTESFELNIYNVNLDQLSMPYTVTADTNETIPRAYCSWTQIQGGSNFYYFNTDGTTANPIPSFTLTITSKANDVMQGTFSGKLNEYNGNAEKTLTEGKFKVTIYRGEHP